MLSRLFLLFLSGLLLHAQSPFRFVAIGDTGSGNAAQRRVADRMWDWMQDHPFHMVLMLGDNIYGNTEITGGGDPRFFHKKFDVPYDRFRERGVVFHAAVGNHDLQHDHARSEIADTGRFGILGAEGYYKLSTPPEFNAGGRPLADFFALNSELRDDAMLRQVEWLKAELPKSNAVWKFIFLHHPLYTVRGQHAPAVRLRRLIEDSLEANHVQFILGGHNHFYARMKPVHGTIQLISGGGGRHLAFPRMDQCAVTSARRHHFLGVEIYPDKVDIVAIDEDGKVLDSASIREKDLKAGAAGCPAR